MSNVLEKLEIPKNIREALRELIEDLEAVLGEDFKLYLFGSYARGDWIKESDIDLIVVSPRFRDTPKHLRVAMVRKLAREDIPFEILCYTPEELEKLLKESSFLREVAKYWIEIR